MNRAERRRAGRESIQKQRTYTLTQEQIDHLKAAAVEEAMVTATIFMLGIPCLVCHDQFGFGKQRLSRMMDKCLFWLDSVQNGEVGLSEIIDVIYKETGYSVTKKGRITK